MRTATWRAARAVAHAAKKQFAHAQHEYEDFQKAKSNIPEDYLWASDTVHRVLELPEDLGGGFGSGQIRDHNPCIDPVVFAEFPGQRFQRAATTGHQHETTAVGGEAWGTRVRASNAVKEVAQPEGIH